MRSEPQRDGRSHAQQRYDQAWQLCRQEIHLDDTPRKGSPGLHTRFKLWRARRLLQSVVSDIPHSWQSMWILGKIHQRLGDAERSLGWFEQACGCKPKDANVAREASIAAMDLGKPEKALKYCEEALILEPRDPGLQANMACASLMMEHYTEAQTYITTSLRAAPDDLVSKNVAALIDHVVRHKTQPPRSSAEMQSYFKKHPELVVK